MSNARSQQCKLLHAQLIRYLQCQVQRALQCKITAMQLQQAQPIRYLTVSFEWTKNSAVSAITEIHHETGCHVSALPNVKFESAPFSERIIFRKSTPGPCPIVRGSVSTLPVWLPRVAHLDFLLTRPVSLNQKVQFPPPRSQRNQNQNRPTLPLARGLLRRALLSSR